MVVSETSDHVRAQLNIGGNPFDFADRFSRSSSLAI
jgi:hypothetical protein